MRKLVCFALLCVGMSAMAQLSNVTGTVTDTDNQTWNNGTFQITFVPPTGYTGSVYTFNGSAWTPTVHNGVMSSSGVLTYSALERNDYILPANSHWKFTVCPNASFPCTSRTVTINQASQSVSSQFNAVQAPRFAASNMQTGSFGYADVEVSPIPVIGAFYWNVTSGTSRSYTGSGWVSGSGGTTINGTSGQVPIIESSSVLNGVSLLPMANTQKIPALMSDLCSGTVANGYGMVYNGANWACGPIGTFFTLAGDVSGGALANTVDKIKGGVIPTSATLIGTNSSGQMVDSSGVTLANNTTGSAASVPYSGLTGSVPTWNQNTTGNAATATNAQSGTPSSALNVAPKSYVDAETTRATAAEATKQINLSATQSGSGSSGTAAFPGFVAAGTSTPTTIGSTGVTFPDGTTQTSSIVPTNHWRSQLNKVLNKTGNARVCFSGSSISLGTNSQTTLPWADSGPVAQLASVLQVSYGIPTAWDGFFGWGYKDATNTYYSTGGDGRVTVGSSWTADTANVSVGGPSYKATTATNAIAYTPVESVDTFRVFYLTNTSAGTISANIDGGAATTQSTAGAAGIGVLTLNTTAGTHTVNVTWSSGGQVNFLGADAYLSTNSVVIFEQLGISAGTSTGLSDKTKAFGPGFALPYQTIGCDLVIEGEWVNDIQQSISATTTGTNTATIVNAATTAGASMALWDENVKNGTAMSLQLPYANAIHAQQTGVAMPWTDTMAMFAGSPSSVNYGWANANNNGWEYADGLHPVAAGYTAMATALAKSIMSTIGQSELPNIDAFTPNLTSTTYTMQTTANGQGFTVKNLNGTTPQTIAQINGFCTTAGDLNDCGALSLNTGGTTFVKLTGYNAGGSYFGNSVAFGTTVSPVTSYGAYFYVPNPVTDMTHYVFKDLSSSNTLIALGNACSVCDAGEIQLSQGGGVNTKISSINASFVPALFSSLGLVTNLSGTSTNRTAYKMVDTSDSFNLIQMGNACNGFDCGEISLYQFNGITATISSISSVTSFVPGPFQAKGFLSTATGCATATPFMKFDGTCVAGGAIRAGAWSISAATSVAVTFATAMSATPASCAVTSTADPTAVGAIWYSGASTTGITVNVHTSGTISGTYQCVLNNGN
jgi:lysophospholipase L1-like esterase